MKNKEKNKKEKRQINYKKILVIVLPIIILISLAIYILLVNTNARKLDKYIDITFVSPYQALVFWKTEEETLGFVKYGEKKYQRFDIELQTTSELSDIHVVFLDQIPLEGLYITIHNDDDNIFVLPKIHHIKYQEGDIEYEQ